MKNSKFFLIVLLLIILLVIVSMREISSRLSSTQTRNSYARQDDVLEDQNLARFENGKLNPNYFVVGHLDTLILQVQSDDNEKIHNIVYPEFNLNAVVMPGERKTIYINALGVGIHTISCGESCTFIVEVTAKMDEETN